MLSGLGERAFPTHFLVYESRVGFALLSLSVCHKLMTSLAGRANRSKPSGAGSGGTSLRIVSESVNSWVICQPSRLQDRLYQVRATWTKTAKRRSRTEPVMHQPAALVKEKPTRGKVSQAKHHKHALLGQTAAPTWRERGVEARSKQALRLTGGR